MCCACAVIWHMQMTLLMFPSCCLKEMTEEFLIGLSSADITEIIAPQDSLLIYHWPARALDISFNIFNLFHFKYHHLFLHLVEKQLDCSSSDSKVTEDLNGSGTLSQNLSQRRNWAKSYKEQILQYRHSHSSICSHINMSTDFSVNYFVYSFRVWVKTEDQRCFCHKEKRWRPVSG